MFQLKTIMVILCGVFILQIASCRRKVERTGESRFDQIRTIQNLHLMRYHYEEIIPIDRKGKLQAMLVVPCYIESYADLTNLQMWVKDSMVNIIMPAVQLSDVLFRIDTATIYDTKHWGITFSSVPYTEALQDIQKGVRDARKEVQKKAIDQKIIEASESELQVFLRSVAHVLGEGKDVQFLRQDSSVIQQAMLLLE